MTNILTRATGARTSADRAVRPGLVLAIVLIGQFMAVLDASIVNVAIPSIHASLHASGASMQLIVAGYTITYAVLLVTGARLGDIIGHRRMFLAGVVVFTLTSLGCGVATTAGAEIALRFAQGVGAAMMIPQVLSLIQRTHAGPSRIRAMGRYSAVIAGGAVVGQVVGGLLISANIAGQTWRPVFLVNVPVGVALFAIGLRALPHGRGEAGRGLDLPGLALLTPAVLAFVLPLVLGQPEHWPVWGWVLLGAVVPLLAVFALAERRGGITPLIPGQVLALPGIAVAIAALFAVMVVFGGYFFMFALHLQSGLAESPLHAGLVFAPSAAAFGVVSLNWRRLPARWHSPMIVIGPAVVAVGMLLQALLLRSGSTGGVWIYLIGVVIGAGMAAAFGPLMTRVLLRVPVNLAADATGVVVTVNQLGIVVGVATLGTLYLNLAGHLPAGASALAFRHTSAHAAVVTMITLAGVSLVGALLAAGHVRGASR
ncbi:MAG TPA: MFS transporter [Streptosporangiaceae bacterium]|nr:MFS transporter [Streptosporangiaceae bacterium]